MTPPRNSNRLIAGMWTLAGLLAWTAVGIRYFGEDTMNWSIAFAGLFCLGMGISAWARRSTAGPGPDTTGPASRG